jgi:tRNA (guanine9-N1)-methyltransferase
VKQIGHCYGKNLRHSSPLRLHLTDFGGTTQTELKKVSGFDKWTIQTTPLPYLEAFAEQKDKLVYLVSNYPSMMPYIMIIS